MNLRSLLLPAAIVTVFVLISIPSFYGIRNVPAGGSWTGILSRNSADLNGYVSIVEEIRQGHYRARNLFTAEPHPPFQVRPLFLALGFMGRIMPGTSSVCLMEWGRAFTSLTLLLILSLFCKRLFENPVDQTVSFFIVTLGSGLGWLRLVPDPPDLRIVEFSTFLTLLSPVLYSASVSLILGILYSVNRALSNDENAIRFSFIAAILGLCLGFDRPFGLGPLFVAVILLWISNPKLKNLFRLIPMAIALLIPVLYQLYAIRTIPVYAAWNRQHTLLTPEWSRFFSSFGLLIPLAMLGVPVMLKKKRNLGILLSGYVAGSVILSHLPFPYQERFVEGFPVCLSIFAAFGFLRLFHAIQTGFLKIAGATLLLFALFPSGFIAWTHDLELIARQSPPQYLPDKVVEGMRQLALIAKPEEAVLSSEASGNFIAAYAGRPVVLGQKIQTVNYFKKWKMVQQIYSSSPDDPKLKNWIMESGAKWVFWGPEEAWLSKGVFQPSRCSFLRQEFDNGFIRLYRFMPE